VCCASSGGASCKNSSQCKGASDYQLCKTATDCGAGGVCATYTCPFIGAVSACKKPPGCN
jgi:hypothetical protein